MKSFSNSSKWQSNQPQKNVTGASAGRSDRRDQASTDQAHGYRDLRIWGKAMEIARLVYDLTDHFPTEERFALSGQLRRTAVAVPSMIAEGHSRMDAQVFHRSLEATLGALAELETQLELARSRNYVTDLELCYDKIRHERSMIQKILRKGQDADVSVSAQRSQS
jgi:four helix bundle protein